MRSLALNKKQESHRVLIGPWVIHAWYQIELLRHCNPGPKTEFCTLLPMPYPVRPQGRVAKNVSKHWMSVDLSSSNVVYIHLSSLVCPFMVPEVQKSRLAHQMHAHLKVTAGAL